MRKRAALDAMHLQRERTLARLGALAPEDWDRPCLPGWQVRDVVAHLVASDQGSVTGRIYVPLLGSPDRSVVERWNDRAVTAWRNRTPAELIAGLERWGRRLERLASWTPSVLARVPVGGAYGRHPAVFLLYLRVLDEWVHEQDIAWAVDRGGGADGLDAGAAGIPADAAQPRDGAAREITATPPLLIGEALATEVLGILPRRGLPRVPRAVGVVRLLVDPAPPGGAVNARPVVWGVDFARHQFGPRVTAKPDAEIRIGAAALALVQESRLPWRALGEPWLAMDGDEALAADLLDALPLNSPEGGEGGAPS